MRDGIVRAETLVDVRAVVPRGVLDGRIGGGTTLAELEVDPQIPDALREACRLAASPQLRSMGTIAGNLRQATRCWYWRLKEPCWLHGGERCFAREGEHREHAIFANSPCASAHPSDVAAALLALGARVRTTARELPIAELYRLPTEDDRDVVALAPDELILELEVPAPEASVYLKAMDRRRWSFPIVGVAAARRGGETRIALAGVAPIPWLLDGLTGSTRRRRCRGTRSRSTSRGRSCGGRSRRWQFERPVARALRLRRGPSDAASSPEARPPTGSARHARCSRRRRPVLAAQTASAQRREAAGAEHSPRAGDGADRARAQRACPLPARLRPAFVRASSRTGLPLALLVAVARVESNLRVDARSERGARGLLQVMPGDGGGAQARRRRPGVERPRRRALPAAAARPLLVRGPRAGRVQRRPDRGRAGRRRADGRGAHLRRERRRALARVRRLHAERTAVPGTWTWPDGPGASCR